MDGHYRRQLHCAVVIGQSFSASLQLRQPSLGWESAVVPLYCFWLFVLANRPTFLVVLIADDGLTSRAIREHHLECALFGCVSKCVVRLHDVVQREAMSHELARL